MSRAFSLILRQSRVLSVTHRDTSYSRSAIAFFSRCPVGEGLRSTRSCDFLNRGGGFIKGILRGVRCTKSLRVLFLHRRPPSWTTLVLYSRAVFIFYEPASRIPEDDLPGPGRFRLTTSRNRPGPGKSSYGVNKSRGLADSGLS